MQTPYNPKIWKKQETILVNLPYNDFDQNASEHFKTMMTTLISKHNCHSIILDFSNIVLIDGTGLAALVFAFNSCSQKDIKLIICSMKENIVDVVTKKGLDTMLEIFKNIHDAVDMATSYSYIIKKRDKHLKDMESIFGDPFEESISYN